MRLLLTLQNSVEYTPSLLSQGPYIISVRYVYSCSKHLPTKVNILSTFQSGNFQSPPGRVITEPQLNTFREESHQTLLLAIIMRIPQHKAIWSIYYAHADHTATNFLASHTYLLKVHTEPDSTTLTSSSVDTFTFWLHVHLPYFAENRQSIWQSDSEFAVTCHLNFPLQFYSDFLLFSLFIIVPKKTSIIFRNCILECTINYNNFRHPHFSLKQNWLVLELGHQLMFTQCLPSLKLLDLVGFSSVRFVPAIYFSLMF